MDSDKINCLLSIIQFITASINVINNIVDFTDQYNNWILFTLVINKLRFHLTQSFGWLAFLFCREIKRIYREIDKEGNNTRAKAHLRRDQTNLLSYLFVRRQFNRKKV